MYLTKDSNSVDAFFRLARKYDVLTKEDEYMLLHKLKTDNDNSIRNKLLLHNLRFIIRTAKEYQNNAPLSDLISAGCYGFLKAIDKFDMSLNYKLISYGIWWIRKEIIEEYNTHNNKLYMPNPVVHTINKIYKITDAYFVEHGHIPTQEYISKKLPKEHNFLTKINLNHTFTPLDKPILGTDDMYIECLIPGDDEKSILDNVDNYYISKNIMDVVNKHLSGKDKYIICERFGFNESKKYKTRNSIGKDLGITGEAVRIREKKSLKILEKNLPNFLIL